MSKELSLTNDYRCATCRTVLLPSDPDICHIEEPNQWKRIWMFCSYPHLQAFAVKMKNPFLTDYDIRQAAQQSYDLSKKPEIRALLYRKGAK